MALVNGENSIKKVKFSAKFMDINLITEEEKMEQEIAQTEVSWGQEGQDQQSPETAETQKDDKGINIKPLIRWVVYGLAFLLPLFFLAWTTEFLEFNKQTLLVLGAGIGLVLYLFDVIKSGVLRYKTSKLYLPIFVFVLMSLLTAFFSKNVFQSFMGIGGNVVYSFVSTLALAVTFFLALNTVEDGGVVLRKTIAGSLFVVFLLAVLQVFGLGIFRSLPASFNTIGSMNTLAVLGALLLPLFLETNLKIPKIKLLRFIDFSKITFFLALFVIVIINWWVAWVAAFVSLLVWMAAKILKTGSRKISVYIVPMLVIVIGGFFILTKFTISLKTPLPVEVSPNYTASLQILGKTLKEKPVFGYGQGNFGLAFDKYKPDSFAGSVLAGARFNQAVSSVFTTGVEGGVIMLLALLFLLGFIIWQIYGSLNMFSFGPVGFIVLMFMFPFNLSLTFLFVVSLALWELQNQHSRQMTVELEKSPMHSVIASVAFVIGLVAVLAGGYFVAVKYIGEVDYANALKQSDLDKGVNYLAQAANRNPYDSRYYRAISQILIAKLANELQSKSQTDKSGLVLNLADSATKMAIRATVIDPNDSQNWANAGYIYQNLINLVGGADAASVNMYKKSLELNPADPQTLTRIGSVYLAVGDAIRDAITNPSRDPKLNVNDLARQVATNYENAEKSYASAVNLNNNFGQAIFNLGVVYDRQGRLAQAVKQFENLRVQNPRDPYIAFQLGLLYYRNGQKDAAFRQLQQAVQLFPNYSNARWYLSFIYEERGDLNSALVQVQAIEKLNPGNDLVAQRLDQLTKKQRTIPPDKVLNKKPLNP